MKKLISAIFTIFFLATSFGTFAQETESTPQFRREFLQYINHVRQKGCNCGVTYMPPVKPITWNDLLEVAAIGHAKDMYSKNYFSHTSKDGRSMEDRIIFAGYQFKGFKSFAIGENIAEGQMSIAEVMAGWFKSEGHCRNLMNPEFKEVGVAWHNDYWVQDFGGREAFSADVQQGLKTGKYKLIQRP